MLKEKAGAALSIPGKEGAVLVTVYSMATLVLLPTAFGTAFLTLYASSDLPLLFAAPLTVRQVFTLKLFEVMAQQAPAALLLALPPVWGYGAGVGTAPSFYPAALLPVFLSLLLPAGLGILCNLIAVRVIPPYRARELAAALGTLLGAAAYALFQLGPRYMHEAGPGRFIGLAERLNISGEGISPVHWLARATAEATRGNFAAYLSWAGLTAAVSLCCPRHFLFPGSGGFLRPLGGICRGAQQAPWNAGRVRAGQKEDRHFAAARPPVGAGRKRNADGPPGFAGVDGSPLHAGGDGGGRGEPRPGQKRSRFPARDRISGKGWEGSRTSSTGSPLWAMRPFCPQACSLYRREHGRAGASGCACSAWFGFRRWRQRP